MPDRNQANLLTVYLLEHVNAIRTRQLGLLGRMAGIRVAGSGASATTELAGLMRHRPDVVLISLGTGYAHALQEVRTLRSMLPDTIVIVLADNLGPPLRRACLKAGGSYCFDKTLELDALRLVMAGLAATSRP
ncbi:response regulator transcription factor (plasmid) [Cupriavidus necator]|uniref:DNA-binding response regulator n=1 Tax=Cupriavidus necator TaxID=106590 RepID=A0A367PL99_CUPNE|nr:response regulator transcription factor [Cupriavidus necator]QQX89878.1 response regulator transcription factor [Cupriavidus necator]RCJ08304.1 DNA-binding response regulator [Cupriavidus necator]